MTNDVMKGLIMAFLDMFDKLDDIVYEPMKAICTWMTEPLKEFEAKRNSKAAAQAAQIEMDKRGQEVDIEIRRAESAARLEMEKKKWDADLDDFIKIKEIQRNERVLEAIKAYRRSLIEEASSIADNLSHMNMSLVAEAHELVLQKTKDYKALQDEASKQCDEQLVEVQRLFANNPMILEKRVNMIINQATNIIEAAEAFISQLNEDIKLININNNARVDAATKAADSILSRMSQSISIESTSATISIGQKQALE